MSRESPFPTVPVADALALVVGKAKGVPLQTETLATSSALGRVLATDVTASEPLPPFPASIKDGYALHVTEDTLAATKDRVFRVIDRIPAGADVSSFTSPLADDCMYQIMTGAAVPPNCNAVVMVEWTELLEKTEDGREAAVRLLKQVPKVGHDIRPVGSDLAPGTVVLEKGTRIGSPEVGLLASVGAREVSVYRRVRVAVMSTGDELLDVSRTDGSLVGAHGKIWDSNRPMLLAMVEELGGGMWEAIDEGIAADDMDGTTAAITRALETADVIISSGGVSMGDVDLVKGWLEQNSTLHFGRVLMKPGKPLTFATVAGSEGEKLFFATPGNPVSSMVTTLLFAIPALRVLSGLREHNHVRTQVVLEQSLRLDPQRPEFHRASVYWHAESSSLHAVSTGVQASSRLLSMRSANALLELPQREGTVAAGSKVSALLIGPILGNQPAIVRAASQHHCHHGHSHGHSHNHSHGHSHGHSHNHSHRGHDNGHSHGHSHTSHAHSHNHGSHSHGHSHGHQQAHNGEQ